jgi:PAS domain S-box-containing protein
VRGAVADQLGVPAGPPAEEQLYRSVIAAMQEGVVVQDADGRVFACNPSAERILGLTADQLKGLTSLDPRWRAVDEQGAPVSGEQHPAVLVRRTGRPQSNVVMGVHKPDGTLAWVLVNARPVMASDEAGLGAVVITFADIAERKLAEQALRESEQRFRLLFENSLDAILLTRPDGAILAANPAACRMFGRSEEELRQVGRQGVVDPDDERLSAILAERARTGAFRGELTHVRADGTRFPAEICTSVYTATGGEVLTSMIVRDLSEQRRAEAMARERLLLEHQATQLARLANASRLFAEAVPDPARVLTLIAEHVAELTGDACTVRLLSDDGTQLRPVAVHHADAELRAAMWQVMEQTTERADVGLWKPVIEGHRAVRVAVAGQIPADASDAQAAFMRRYPMSAIMGVPLIARGRVLGGISLVRYGDGTPFTDADASFLELLALRAALTIDNARLYDDARAQLASWRALVENAPDIISRFDRDLRHLYVNPAVETATGLPASAMIGKSSRELGMPEPLVTSWEVALRGVFDLGRERTVELEFPARVGERHYQARVTPELGPDGAVETVLMIARDITDRRTLELERNELYHGLLERDRRLQEAFDRLLGDREFALRRVVESTTIEELTPREKEILQLVAVGRTNDQIGRSLNLSVGTVKNHVARIIDKLEAPDRTAAAVRAFRLGLIELD